jgi:hypothetical protein
MLPAHRTTLRTFASAGIRVSSLTARRQSPAVAKAAIATEIHEPLDVHVDLAAQIAFHLEVLIDALANLLDVVLVKVVSALVLGDARHLADLLRPVRTDPVDVLQRNHCLFATRKVDACDSCQSLLSLPLLVTGVFAQNAYHAFAAYDLALFTNLSDAWSNLHVSLSLIRPLVGS